MKPKNIATVNLKDDYFYDDDENRRDTKDYADKLDFYGPIVD
jgi:hypothetical protein